MKNFNFPQPLQPMPTPKNKGLVYQYSHAEFAPGYTPEYVVTLCYSYFYTVANEMRVQDLTYSLNRGNIQEAIKCAMKIAKDSFPLYEIKLVSAYEKERRAA